MTVSEFAKDSQSMHFRLARKDEVKDLQEDHETEGEQIYVIPYPDHDGLPEFWTHWLWESR